MRANASSTRDGWLTMKCSGNGLPSRSLQPGHNSNGTLYATTLLSQQRGKCATCQTCLSSDHHTSQCTLSEERSSYQSLSPGPKQKWARSRTPKKSTQIYYAWNDGKCTRETLASIATLSASSVVRSTRPYSATNTQKVSNVYNFCCWSLNKSETILLLPIGWHWWFPQFFTIWYHYAIIGTLCHSMFYNDTVKRCSIHDIIRRHCYPYEYECD